MQKITVMAALSLVFLGGCIGGDDTGPDDLVGPAGDPNSGDPDGTDAGSGTDGDSGDEGPTANGSAWEPVWAQASAAAIQPGMQTFTEGAQCTANFVFYDADDVYIGQAAHCAGTGAATDTDGCLAGTHPVGTEVDLGTGNLGTIVYSSWVTMQAAGEKDADACQYNDFALIKVAEADEAVVSPAVPFFGGPVGLAPTAGLGVGDEVYSFGHSGLRPEAEPLSWKHGTVVESGPWYVGVYTATPGIPGDSGSGFMDADGNAIGVLSTLAVLPYPAENMVAGLMSALAYMESHGGPQVELGTAPFEGGVV